MENQLAIKLLFTGVTGDQNTMEKWLCIKIVVLILVCQYRVIHMEINKNKCNLLFPVA